MMSTLNKEQLGSPGPGMYGATGQWGDKGKQVKIGTAARPDHMVKKDDESKPGPGNYEAVKPMGGSGFGFGVKPKAKYNDNPGPGSY